jgi:cysteine synthase A
MSNIKRSITELVGHTPLLELTGYERAHGLRAHLLAKLEYLNPTGSVKDRPALNMLLAAERAGLIHPGDTLVDSTSGNTGISEAAFCAARGYQLEEILEDGTTSERAQILRAYGVKLSYFSDFPEIEEMLANGDLSIQRLGEVIQAYCDNRPDHPFFIGQILNPHNPEAHVLSTGPELWQDTDGRIDALVCMLGTAGTVTGLSDYLRPRLPKLHIAAVQPAPASRPSAEHPQVNIIDGVVPFADVPEASQPVFLKDGVYDEYIDILTEDAYETAHELARYDGLFVGTSAAAATRAATALARREEFAGKNIVVIIPDDGMKYLSTPLYQ